MGNVDALWTHNFAALLRYISTLVGLNCSSSLCLRLGVCSTAVGVHAARAWNMASAAASPAAIADSVLIDGAEGEGGGQILRSAVSLSAITGRRLRIIHIRKNRPKPGLAKQHLTSVAAAAKVCNASLQGCEIGSVDLEFIPGAITPGDYAFDVGTAGSTTLVLQTVLPLLLQDKHSSSVTIKGGTHNTLAPPFEFIRDSYLPALRSLRHDVSVELQRHGFYPAGGGCIAARVTRALESTSSAAAGQATKFSLLDRGELRLCAGSALVSNLPKHIAERELTVLKSSAALCSAGLLCGSKAAGASVPALASESGATVDLSAIASAAGVMAVAANGPGNVVQCTLAYNNVVEVCTGYGEKGKSAEAVAAEVVREVELYLASTAPVSCHLADQLLLPLALSQNGGTFRCVDIDDHFKSNVKVIEAFLGAGIVTVTAAPAPTLALAPGDSTASDGVISAVDAGSSSSHGPAKKARGEPGAGTSQLARSHGFIVVVQGRGGSAAL